MNSLTELNAVGASVLEVDDTRPATVLFDLDTRYANLDTIVVYPSRFVTFEPSINVEEIRNYASANLRFRVEIITTGITPNSSISFGTVGPHISVSQSGETYTVSGLKSSADWDQIKNFSWTLPADYTSSEFLYLKLSFLYYNEELPGEQQIDWYFVDELYYYLSKMIGRFDAEITGRRLKNSTANLITVASVSADVRVKQAQANLTVRLPLTVTITGPQRTIWNRTSRFVITAQGEPTSFVNINSNFTTNIEAKKLKNGIVNMTMTASMQTLANKTIDNLINASSAITITADTSSQLVLLQTINFTNSDLLFEPAFPREGAKLILPYTSAPNTLKIREYNLSSDRASISSIDENNNLEISYDKSYGGPVITSVDRTGRIVRLGYNYNYTTVDTLLESQATTSVGSQYNNNKIEANFTTSTGYKAIRSLHTWSVISENSKNRQYTIQATHNTTEKTLGPFTNTISNEYFRTLPLVDFKDNMDIAYDSTNNRHWVLAKLSNDITTLLDSTDNYTAARFTFTDYSNQTYKGKAWMDDTATYVMLGLQITSSAGGYTYGVKVYKRTGTTWSYLTTFEAVSNSANNNLETERIIFSDDAKRVIIIVHGITSNPTYMIFDRDSTGTYVKQQEQTYIPSTKYSKGFSTFSYSGSFGVVHPNNPTQFDFGTGNFTIESWIRLRQIGWDYELAAGKRTIYVQGGSTSGLELFVQVSGTSGGNSTNPIVRLRLGSSTTTVSSTLSFDTWYHVAVVRSGTSVKVYIDGVETNSQATTSPIDSNGDGVSFCSYMSGWVSNLRVVKGSAVYTGNFTPSSEPLTSITGTSLLTAQNYNLTNTLDYSGNNFNIISTNDSGGTVMSPFSTYNPYRTPITMGSDKRYVALADYNTTPYSVNIYLIT